MLPSPPDVPISSAEEPVCAVETVPMLEPLMDHGLVPDSKPPLTTRLGALALSSTAVTDAGAAVVTGAGADVISGARWPATVRCAVSDAVENALLPPRRVALAMPPSAPEVWSQAT